MEEEEVTPLKEMASNSVQSGGEEATHSSDNESWTILDEDEEEEVTLNARVDVIQAVAEFTKRENHSAPVETAETDSDIETIDEKDESKPIEAEVNLESLNSDGIPVGEELSSSGDQYLWSSETTEVNEDEDDLEIIENVPPTHDSLCPSGYPPEELMERFSEIVKGRTYLHHPNQALNLYLTGTLIVVAALVFGLGLGHFKGWSERLELQEQYADIREERMDELTESLVSCMTGEEGLGGEDQDLDDIVIRQLRDENEKLKYELQMLKHTTDEDNSANEEMTAILRDRINDLLVANFDLEKQVVRLRYAPPTFQDMNEDELMETKETLNTMAHENDQLKLAIAKERYGPRQVPLEAKEKLNLLQIDNEELKIEVRKFRYGVHDVDDAGYNTTTEEELFEDVAIDENEPNFVTLTRLQSQPVLPPVILMGGKQKDIEINEEEKVIENDDFQNGFDDINGDEDFIEDLFVFDDDDDDEGFVDDDEDFVEEDEEESAQNYFQSFKDFMDDNFHHKLALDAVKVGKVIDEFKKNAQDLLPDKEQIQKIKQSAEDLSKTLKEKWDELDFVQEKDKLKEKLTKTIFKALKKAKDAVSEEFEMDAELWSQRLTRVQDKFHTKWQEVMGKFSKKEKTCAKNKDHENNNDKKESVEKKKDKKTKKEYSSWSKKNSNSNITSSWIFERAKNRDDNRKKNTKSDWLFDRASSRKRFHHLLTDAESYNRRFYSKHCDGEDCRTIEQETYAPYVNHGNNRRSKHPHNRGETQPLNQYIRDLHDDDEDEDEDEDDFEASYVRVQKSFAGSKRRGYQEGRNTFQHQETKKSKKAEKRGRYHERSNQNHHRKQQPHFRGDHVVHMMHNKFH